MSISSRGICGRILQREREKNLIKNLHQKKLTESNFKEFFSTRQQK
jgi:hypothetical protein